MADARKVFLSKASEDFKTLVASEKELKELKEVGATRTVLYRQTVELLEKTIQEFKKDNNGKGHEKDLALCNLMLAELRIKCPKTYEKIYGKGNREKVAAERYINALILFNKAGEFAEKEALIGSAIIGCRQVINSLDSLSFKFQSTLRDQLIAIHEKYPKFTTHRITGPLYLKFGLVTLTPQIKPPFTGKSLLGAAVLSASQLLAGNNGYAFLAMAGYTLANALNTFTNYQNIQSADQRSRFFSREWRIAEAVNAHDECVKAEAAARPAKP